MGFLGDSFDSVDGTILSCAASLVSCIAGKRFCLVILAKIPDGDITPKLPCHRICVNNCSSLLTVSQFPVMKSEKWAYRRRRNGWFCYICPGDDDGERGAIAVLRTLLICEWFCSSRDILFFPLLIFLKGENDGIVLFCYLC